MTTIEDMSKTDMKCPACDEPLYYNPATGGEIENPNVPDETRTFESKNIVESVELRCSKCWSLIYISVSQAVQHGLFDE